MKSIALMYHDITDVPEASGFSGADAALYKISVSEFEKNLLAMANRKIQNPISAENWNSSENAFFITFDDGGKSAMQTAEKLEKYNWRGHFFITTGRIGTPAFLSKQEILDLRKRGHLIGSHSDSHPLRMASLTRNEIFSEWKISTAKLAEILGEKVRVASVPGGLYSKEVAECAEENGIRFLFNSEPSAKTRKVGNCTVFGRYNIKNGMRADVVAAIAAGEFLPRIRQTLIWNLKKPLKKIGGESFLKLRKFLINQKAEIKNKQ